MGFTFLRLYEDGVHVFKVMIMNNGWVSFVFMDWCYDR
jgi:hypothetical protein